MTNVFEGIFIVYIFNKISICILVEAALILFLPCLSDVYLAPSTHLAWWGGFGFHDFLCALASHSVLRNKTTRDYIIDK